MQKNVISSKQAIYIMILFFIGSSSVTGVSTVSKQDSWISFLLALIMFIPLILMYSRIIKLFPQKNLYDILYELFGKLGGFVLSLIYIFYSLQLGALVMRNFTEYIKIISLIETPQYILALFLGIICLWLLKNGLEVLGSISIVFLPIIVIFLFFTIIFLTKYMNFCNIKPIGVQGLNTIFSGARAILLYPFGESVLFMIILSSLRPKDSPYKVYLSSMLIGGFILFVILLQNILVLGIPTMQLVLFPSFTAASIINIDDFITRIEILITASFIFAGIIKVSICIYASTKGFSKVLKIDNYKLILGPITFLIIAFSSMIYNNTMQMIEFTKTTEYYFVILQIILPLIILIFAEVKVRKTRKLSKQYRE